MEAWSFFWISHLRAKAQGLWPSSAAFSGHIQEAESEVEQMEHKPAPYGMLVLQVED